MLDQLGSIFAANERSVFPSRDFEKNIPKVSELRNIFLQCVNMENNIEEQESLELFTEENGMIRMSQYQLQVLREAHLLQQQHTLNDDDHTQQQESQEQLVDIMPAYPALWNTSLCPYKDLNKKEAAWKEISIKLHI